jgi:hypothetical protein
MNAAEIVAALEQHGARVAVKGEKVRLIFQANKTLPDGLVRAARLEKEALRVFVNTPETLPAYIGRGLDRLAKSPPLWPMPEEQWAELMVGARAVAVDWGLKALRLAWRDVDLFGLHPSAPGARYDCRGLAFSVRLGGAVVAITADAAVINQRGDRHLSFYRRRDDAGAVLAWDLCEG